MNALLIAGLALGVLSSFAVLSSLLEGVRAPSRLKRAEAAFRSGDLAETRRHLALAFHVPLTGVYRPGAATTALSVLALFERLLRGYAEDPTVLTEALKDRIELSAQDGTPVPRSHSRPLKNLLWRMAAKDADIRTLVRRAKAYWATHQVAEVAPDDGYTLIPDPRLASRSRG